MSENRTPPARLVRVPNLPDISRQKSGVPAPQVVLHIHRYEAPPEPPRAQPQPMATPVDCPDDYGADDASHWLRGIFILLCALFAFVIVAVCVAYREIALALCCVGLFLSVFWLLVQLGSIKGNRACRWLRRDF